MRTLTALVILPAETTTPTLLLDTFLVRNWPSKFAGRDVNGIVICDIPSSYYRLAEVKVRAPGGAIAGSVVHVPND